MSATDGRDWLSLPELAERFGLPLGKVRRLIEDRHLIALRVDGALRVPGDFLDGDAPLHDLRGTIMLLGDNGFSDDEAVDWLLAVDESLDVSPVEALRAGRKAEVRRVAQALA
ncbi:Rv2175c family DNA-binding protein [Herbiconiux sp. L3-i23]|uniref:Rv2175c family DNA-binding protein n=1 Tax=Herbiconiux sp. L3-i23 TaxID=2905871 RepID=UPI002072DE0A|nr:Rv2175c family DNA-binding protein [Herbiconiux sp. L3-i23]